MIRQNLTIGPGFQYVVDLYKANEAETTTYKNFVMLRKFNIMDDVAYDTDIYFIEKDIVNDILNNKDVEVIYPASNSINKYFSSNYTNFNSDIQFESMIYDLYKYDATTENFILTPIACDKFRMYHPHNKVSIDAIVYVDSIINNIHYHFFCKKYELQQTYAETDFTIENTHYCEYIEFYIPNMENLFDMSIYYKENLGNVQFDLKKDGPEIHDVIGNEEETESSSYSWAIEFGDNNNILTEYQQDDDYRKYQRLIVLVNDKDLYVSLFLFLAPFSIRESEMSEGVKTNVKYYSVAVLESIGCNYVSFPVKVTLYPYSNNADSFYILDSSINSNSDVFMTDERFMLSSKIEFVEGVASIKSDMLYPNPDKYSSFREAYEKYNNVNLSNYENIKIALSDEDPDYDESKSIVSQIGYRLMIASDPEFKNIIYHDYIEPEHIDNAITYEDQYASFAFNLKNIFRSWKEMPEIIVCEVQFIDKYIGTVISGNQVILTKEWYKYLVNKNNRERIMLNNDKFNFVDKVTCVIKKNETTQNNNISINNSPKILYKPVFYRVQDLQDIKLRYKISQNIGINLSEYLTKVDTFKMIINDEEYIESARNDIYVIFNINTNNFKYTSGTYHITNQDDEYISSGNWTLIQ